MRFFLRHAVAAAVFSVALLATAAVSDARIYSVAGVRQAFAHHGIDLRYASHIHHGSTRLTLLSATRVPKTRGVTVTVADRGTRVSWSAKLDRSVERFSNVAVSYEGDDPFVLNAIEAAVSNLTTKTLPTKRSWPVATRACERMQAEISFYGWDHWRPVNSGRPLAKVASLRRELWVIHATGIRGLKAHTYAEARALHLYRNMLVDIRRVIRAAERGNVSAYTAADVRMVLSISATRAAFKRAGAANICNFAI